MKRVIPTFSFFLSLWLLICFTDQAHGSRSPLDASLISHDTLDLLRRQETTNSSNGDSDTAQMASPDGSTNTSPDSTGNAPSSSPPSPETTAASTDTKPPSNPPVSTTPPTTQSSADPPAQSTSHQSIPGSATTTTAAEASVTGHTTVEQHHSDQSTLQTQSQARKTTPSTSDTPSITPPPTTLNPTSAISSSYAPVESAVTSINSTLVLGDMECASDPLAQQNGRCPANHYCNAALKQCAMQFNNGATCAADFQCTSGYCIGTCADRSTSNNSTQTLTGGQIAGITLGTIGGGLVVLVGLLFCYRRRKRRMAAQESRAMHFMLEGDTDGNGTEMADKHGKATTRLSKYNFLAQILDGGHQQQQQQSHSFGFDSSQQNLAYRLTSPDNTTVNNDTHSILDYQNEYYVSESSLNHPPALFNTRPGSSSTTALRPRPVTDDFNNETTSYTSLPKHRPDSQALSMEQRYPMQQQQQQGDTFLVGTRRTAHRDSLTDTALSAQQSPIISSSHRQFPEQQHQHFMDITTLWDDALHQSTHHQSFRHPPAPMSTSQDAWSHEDQASLASTAPTTPRNGYPTGTVPPLPSGPVPTSSHPPFF